MRWTVGIGSENDLPAVGRPNGTVLLAWFRREARGDPPQQIVNPNVVCASPRIRDVHGCTLPVRRDSRQLVLLRAAERANLRTAAIEPCQSGNTSAHFINEHSIV